MAVAHDAVGPSSAGAGANSVTNISWTHTTGSVSNPLIMVAGQFDYSSDTGVTASCQSDASSTGVSAVGSLVHSNNTTQGFLAMFSVTGTGAATGAHTIKITASSAAQDIAGGSESFSGAGGTGTPVTGAGPSTTGPSVSITAAPTSVIFAAVASGNTISTQNQTQNFIKNQAGGSGFATGNIGCQRATGTGSSLAMSWTTSSGPYAAMAVEVTQFITPTVAPAVHRPRPGRQRPRQGLRKRWQWQPALTNPALAVNAGVATVGATAPGYKKFLTGLAGGTAGYFVDQGGSPLLFYNQVVFGLPANAGRWNSGNWQLDYDTYFADIAGMGMTAAEVHPWGHTHTGCNNDAGNTWDSVSPWTTIPTLNNTFWQRIDYMLTAAQRNGITVLMCLTMQCDMGMDAFAGTGVFNGTSASTIQTACQNIAARYAGRPNLLFFHGDDYNNNDDTRMNAALAGLRAGGYAGPTSIEYYSSGTTSRRDLSGSPTGTQFPWGAANANWNWCYYYHVTYFAVEQAYKENSQIPVLWGDGFFTGGGAGEPADTHLMRNFVWWALASGARGCSMGSETVLRWPSTAFTDLMTSQLWFTTTALNVYKAFSGLPGWQNLIPDNSNLLVTAGRGTRATYSSTNFQAANLGSDNYVAASVTPDKSLAVIYCAVAMSITIDPSQVATGYTAAWMDPANGTLTPTSTGSTYSSSGLGNNSAGNADWVLVLQGPATPSASPNAGVATVGAVTGTNITQTANTASAGVATVGAVTGTGITQTANTANTSAGTVAAAAPAPLVAARANAAPGTVLAQAPAGLAAGAVPAGAAASPAVAPPPLAATGGRAGPGTIQGTAPAPAVAETVNATPGAVLAVAPAPVVSTSSATSAPAGVAAVSAAAPAPVPAAGAQPPAPVVSAAAPAPSVTAGGIAYRDGATVTATAVAHTTTPTITVPSTVQPGDVLAVAVSVFTFTPTSPDFTVTASSGHAWTGIGGGLRDSGASGGLNLFGKAWKRVATSGDASDTLTFAFTGTAGATDQFWWAIAVIAYQNAGDIEASNGASGHVAPNVMPSVTTITDGDWQVAIGCEAMSGAQSILSPPSGLTSRQNTGTAGIDLMIADSGSSVGNAGTSIGSGAFVGAAGATSDWWADFVLALAPLTVRNAPAGVAAVGAAATQPSVLYGAGGAPPAAAAAVQAAGPSTAVTVNAGVATVGAAVGGLTGAAVLTMKLASTNGTTHVETWTATCDMNSGGAHAVRILRPQAPPAGTPHAFLHCLPVDVEGVTSWGSALDILQAAGYHDKYNVTIVEPTFGASPWYADHPSDATKRHESFTVAVAWWCTQNITSTGGQPTLQGNEAHHLIGFSKSGLGAFDLLANNPQVYGKAALWDTPFSMTAYDRFAPESSAAYGSQAAFAARYETDSLHVQAKAGPLQAVVTRLWMGHGVLYPTEMASFDSLLTSIPVKHAYDGSNDGSGSHEFASQWVLPGADAILPATGDPSHPGHVIANPATPSVGAQAGVATVGAVAPQPVVQTAAQGTANAGAATVGAQAPAPAPAAGARPGPATGLASAPAGAPAGSVNAGVPAVTTTAPPPVLTAAAQPGPAPAGAVAPAPAPSAGIRPTAAPVLAVAPAAVAQTIAQGTAQAGVAAVGAVAPPAQVPMAKPAPATGLAVAPQPAIAVTVQAGVAAVTARPANSGQQVGPVPAAAVVAATGAPAVTALASRPAAQPATVGVQAGTVTVVLTGLVTKLKLMAAAPPRGRWAAGPARGKDTGWAAEPPHGEWSVNWPHE